jgi:hypothetical protein
MAAAAAIFENVSTLPVLRFLDSACFSQYVYQISSKSVNKWPTHSSSLIFKMTSAAIFKNGGTLPVLHFLNSACLF